MPRRARPLSETPQGPLPAFISHLERFDEVESTQAVVRGWLEQGVGEVCVAVADRQTRGRGRLQRLWQDAPGRALLVSAGFRPARLPLSQAWRLPAIASVAMIGAATSLLGPTADRLGLKWPNDIVALHRGRLLKLAGMLTEVTSRGDDVDTLVLGLGVNVDWAKADFPPQLADSMWSLSEASGRRRIDRDALLAAWLTRLEPLYADLALGRFDGLRWADVQITTGADVAVDTGEERVRGTAVGVDHETGALLIRTGPGQPLRIVGHGDVVRCEVDIPG